MTTTTAVTVESIPAQDADPSSLADALFFDGLPDLPDSHPAVDAWEKLMNEVIEEVRPEVARLFTEAVERRLPWTWEPE